MLGIGYAVRRYDWGSPTAVPELLGLPSDGTPWAELWLGDHPLAPARIVDRADVTLRLDQVVRRDGPTVLGPDHARWGGRLPYMIKILGIAEPLSLQVHPDLARARAGYAREESAGLPLDAHGRSYKDPNHKPEMILALTEFEALVGFRPLVEVRAALKPLDAPLARAMEGWLTGPEPLRGAMTGLLAGDVGPTDIAGLVDACVRCRSVGLGDVVAYSVVRALARRYQGDPGVAVSLLLRHRVLAPGETMFVPTGTIHSYLRGVAVEILADSDNVLRAGLTPKYVDIAELLACTEYSYAAPVRPREARTGMVREIVPPVADFRLADIRVAGPVELAWTGPRVCWALEGEVFASAGGHTRRLTPGEAVFVLGSEPKMRLHGHGRAVVGAPGE
jgi:mannose-6-phosphate isomerase